MFGRFVLVSRQLFPFQEMFADLRGGFNLNITLRLLAHFMCTEFSLMFSSTALQIFIWTLVLLKRSLWDHLYSGSGQVDEVMALGREDLGFESSRRLSTSPLDITTMAAAPC